QEVFSIAIFPRDLCEFCSENAGGLPAQDWAIKPGCLPDFIPVDSKICVDEDIAEGHHLWPGNLGIPAGQLIHAGKKRGNVADRLDYVTEVQVVTPHRRVARLEALTHGCAASARFLKRDRPSCPGAVRVPASTRHARSSQRSHP